MTELELLDAMAKHLEKLLANHEFITKNGTWEHVKVFKQFLPQPEGLSVNVKENNKSIVPQGYTGQDLYANFPCVVVRVLRVNDEQVQSMRQCIIDMNLFVGIYDDSSDCQGYQDVFNIMEVIRQDLLTMPACVLAGKFRLVPPLKSELADDSEFPYFFGVVNLLWEAARPMNITNF